MLFSAILILGSIWQHYSLVPRPVFISRRGRQSKGPGINCMRMRLINHSNLECGVIWRSHTHNAGLPVTYTEQIKTRPKLMLEDKIGKARLGIAARRNFSKCTRTLVSIGSEVTCSKSTHNRILERNVSHLTYT